MKKYICAVAAIAFLVIALCACNKPPLEKPSIEEPSIEEFAEYTVPAQTEETQDQAPESASSFYSYNRTPWDDNISISKRDEKTLRFYEESDNGYRAAFYQKKEITVEIVQDWIESCEQADGYYQYVYSDPDSWDMFIYYSCENFRFSGNGLKFAVEGSVVKVYAGTNPAMSYFQDYILIRIQAPLRGAWPSSSELCVNGDKIPLRDYQWNN